jgi:hypothetical protein
MSEYNPWNEPSLFSEKEEHEREPLDSEDVHIPLKEYLSEAIDEALVDMDIFLDDVKVRKTAPYDDFTTIGKNSILAAFLKDPF